METFPVWLENTLAAARANPWHLDNHIRPQCQFVSKHTKLFKFEDGLENIWSLIGQEAGLPAPVAFERQLDTSGFDGKIEWDVKEVNLVREYYRQDFEQFEFDIFSYDD